MWNVGIIFPEFYSFKIVSLYGPDKLVLIIYLLDKSEGCQTINFVLNKLRAINLSGLITDCSNPSKIQLKIYKSELSSSSLDIIQTL